jgi:hypothetical protein
VEIRSRQVSTLATFEGTMRIGNCLVLKNFEGQLTNKAEFFFFSPASHVPTDAFSTIPFLCEYELVRRSP